MSRVKVEVLGEEQHPSERMIAVTSATGEIENVIVDRRSIEDDTIDVGYPVGSEDGAYLIELPRETTTGQWRIWVKKSDVLDGVAA